jgi:hypothetical protein
VVSDRRWQRYAFNRHTGMRSYSYYDHSWGRLIIAIGAPISGALPYTVRDLHVALKLPCRTSMISTTARDPAYSERLPRNCSPCDRIKVQAVGPANSPPRSLSWLKLLAAAAGAGGTGMQDRSRSSCLALCRKYYNRL